MANRNYQALRNLHIGDGRETGEDGKPVHRQVKKGDVFECDEDFAEEHLNPLDEDEEHEFHGEHAVEHHRAHHLHFVRETAEPVTANAKIEARKKTKLSKAEKKAAARAAKEAAAQEKKD